MGQSVWKGVVFSTSLFLSCFFGSLVLLTPCIPVVIKWPAVGRRIMDFFLWLWFLFAAAVYELFLGVKVVIHGKPAPVDHSVLILCNHRTRLDWLFLVSYQLRCGNLSQYRISLKSALKLIPGPGWAMQCAGFLFLHRDWKKDQDWISRSIRYFAKVGTKPQFLLFPEGTDYCANGLAKSRKFAEANGLPMYEFVLHPRTTGFVHFVNKMKENEVLDSVLDVTVAYPQNIVHSEMELGKGTAPEEVHFYANNYLLPKLPESSDKLESWCRDVWVEKEATLKKYYEDKQFTVNGQGSPVSAEKERSVQRLLWCIVGFWAVFLSVVFYALVFFPLFKWYCILSALTFVFLGRTYGGVDSLLYASCD